MGKITKYGIISSIVAIHIIFLLKNELQHLKIQLLMQRFTNYIIVPRFPSGQVSFKDIVNTMELDARKSGRTVQNEDDRELIAYFRDLITIEHRDIPEEYFEIMLRERESLVGYRVIGKTVLDETELESVIDAKKANIRAQKKLEEQFRQNKQYITSLFEKEEEPMDLALPDELTTFQNSIENSGIQVNAFRFHQ